MRYFAIALLTSVILGSGFGQVEAKSAATLCVNPGGTGGCYSSIQAAVSAAGTGDTINVAAGTYTEQVFISTTLTLVGAGIDSSIIKAPVTIPPSSNPDSVVVKIAGSGINVELSGLTISGPGPGSCGTIAAGIFVRDGASANIHDNKVVDIRDNPMSGCQNGVGILVGRAAWATNGSATLTNNILQTYQKGGIVVSGSSSSATVSGNIVAGVGPTSSIAQNGVQISSGAVGNVTGNTITGHVWTGTYGGSNDPVSDPDADGSTGILPYFSSLITITGNILNANQFGIWSVGTTSVSIVGNAITGTVAGGNVYPVGIAISDSDQWASSETATTGSITNNSITSHTYGLFVQDFVAGGAVPNPRVGGSTCSQANKFKTNTKALWYGVGSAYSLDATNNNWNDLTNVSAIANLIWDHTDNPSLGTVLFQPFCGIYRYIFPIIMR